MASPARLRARASAVAWGTVKELDLSRSLLLRCCPARGDDVLLCPPRAPSPVRSITCSLPPGVRCVVRYRLRGARALSLPLSLSLSLSCGLVAPTWTRTCPCPEDVPFACVESKCVHQYTCGLHMCVCSCVRGVITVCVCLSVYVCVCQCVCMCITVCACASLYAYVYYSAPRKVCTVAIGCI